MQYKKALKKILEVRNNSSPVRDRVEGLNLYESRVELSQEHQELFYKYLIEIRELEGNKEICNISEIIKEDYPEISKEIRYWLLLQEILEREIVLLGDEAVEIATEIEGIILEEIDIVSVNGSSQELLQQLFNEFKEVQGEVASFLISQHMGEVSLKDINVPEGLREKISE